MNGNTRESLMRQIQMYAFTAHECALYLDCHPQNRAALQKHHEAVRKMNEAVETYEGLYGPLTTKSALSENGWGWVKGKWPWQNQDWEVQR